MWNLAYADSIDLHNSLPIIQHPTMSPSQLYDHITTDVSKNPWLPFGSIVIGHIP